jgi:hypothetical protein
MQYFEVARPNGDGHCSDNACPCGYPGATIPRGTGYLYISEETVDFRRDAPTIVEAQAKMARLRQRYAGGAMMLGQSIQSSILVCERGARKRKLDLEIAAADAAYWWETGFVPLRATPTSQLKTRTFWGRTDREALEAAAEEVPSASAHDIRVTQRAQRRSATASRNTAEVALEAARKKVPDDAFDVSDGEIVEPAGRGTVQVGAFSRDEAHELCQAAAPKGAAVKSPTRFAAHTRGFLGIGRRPGIWRADWSKQAVARVTYKLPAVVTVRLKESSGAERAGDEEELEGSGEGGAPETVRAVE